MKIINFLMLSFCGFLFVAPLQATTLDVSLDSRLHLGQEKVLVFIDFPAGPIQLATEEGKASMLYAEVKHFEGPMTVSLSRNGLYPRCTVKTPNKPMYHRRVSLRMVITSAENLCENVHFLSS